MDIPPEMPPEEMCVKKSKTETNPIVCGISEMIQRMSTLDFFSHFVEIDIFKEHRNDPYLAKDIAEKVNSLNADPNEKGHTPVHLAIIKGNLSVVRWMIEYNADLRCVSISGENHWNALNVAYEYGTPDMFELVMEKERTTERCKDGKTYIAIQSMIDEKYKYLEIMAKYINLNHTLLLDTGKDTLLSWAVKKKDYRAISIFLNQKADPAVCITGTIFSPFHIAVGYAGGDIKATRILAPRMKRVNFSSEEQPFTPLFCAVFANNMDVVKYLLCTRKVYPTLHRKTDHYQTPLHIATLRGNVLMVRLLLEHEANPFKLDQHGTRACDIGIGMGGEMAKTYKSFFFSTQKAAENVSQLSKTVFDVIPELKNLPIENPLIDQTKD